MLQFNVGDAEFEDILVYLVMFHSFVHTIEVYKAGESKPWPDDDTGSMTSDCLQKTLSWVPSRLTRPLCFQHKPKRIEFTEEDYLPSTVQGLHNLGAIEPIMFALAQSMMTNFYERNLRKIEARFSENNSK